MNLRINNSTVTWAVLGCLLLPELVFSSENDSDLTDLSMDQLLKVTVATKDRKSLFQVPANVTVFTRDDIVNYGFRSLQELLNFVPGFYSARDVEQGTMQRISVRGRSTALSESVLVLLDGQRLNDLYTGGATLLNRRLSLKHVARVEIIRGPGSALYGSNAFLGVINIITRKSGNELEVGAGSHGLQRAHWFGSGQSANANEWSVFLESFTDEGEGFKSVTDAFGRTESTRDPISGADLVASAAYNNWVFRSRFSERKRIDFLVFGNHSDQSREYMHQWSLGIDHDQRMSDDWQFKTRLSMTRDLWDTRATLIPAGIEIEPGFSLDENFYGGPRLRTQAIEFQMDHSLFLTSEQALLIGTQLQDYKVLDVVNVTTHNPITLEYFGEFRYNRETLNFSSREQREIASVYAQHQWTLTKQWQLTSGLRYDRYSDFGRSINPRMGLIWSYAENSSIKFLYATAFRAPNFLELYDRNNPVDFGNPELNAEEVRTSEIAWLSQTGHWRFEWNLFHNEFDDLIQLGAPVIDPNNPLLAPTFLNGGKTESTGMEGTVNYQPNVDFEIIAKWSWLKNNEFVQTPLVHWSLQAFRRWEEHTVSVSANHVSADPMVDGQGDYDIVKLHWRYKLSPLVQITVGVNNAFDESYRTASTVFEQGVINRGREWFANATWQLD